MGEFKEGQYVVATRNALHIEKGEIVQVEKYARPTSLGEWLMIKGKRNNTGDGSYEEDGFEAWTPKVGERVVEAEPKQHDLIARWREFWESTEGPLDGGSFLVTKTNGNWVHYSNRVGGNGPIASPDCFAPLPVAAEAQQAAPLKIEAGKFYRTRDGRKVGPLRDNGDAAWNDDEPCLAADVDSLNKLFRVTSGKHLFNEAGLDLIAEWVDEAATRAPVAAQVDAIAEEYGPVVAAGKDNMAERKLLKTHQGYGYELARFGNHVWVDVGKAAPVTMRADKIAA